MTETDRGYVLSKTLVHGLIFAILTALISISGYMIVWNAEDKAWKRGIEVQVASMVKMMGKVEAKVEAGILPQADWRVRQLESWTDEHERVHNRQSP